MLQRKHTYSANLICLKFTDIKILMEKLFCNYGMSGQLLALLLADNVKIWLVIFKFILVNFQVKSVIFKACLVGAATFVSYMYILSLCILPLTFLSYDLKDFSISLFISLCVYYYFRVTEDFVGLKEQSLTNQIVTYFITNYHDIFKKEPHFSETDDILPASISNSSRQVPAMVSSWPEVRKLYAFLLSLITLIFYNLFTFISFLWLLFNSFSKSKYYV